MTMFNGYVKLPEGINWSVVAQSVSESSESMSHCGFSNVTKKHPLLHVLCWLCSLPMLRSGEFYSAWFTGTAPKQSVFTSCKWWYLVVSGGYIFNIYIPSGYLTVNNQRVNIWEHQPMSHARCCLDCQAGKKFRYFCRFLLFPPAGVEHSSNSEHISKLGNMAVS